MSFLQYLNQRRILRTRESLEAQTKVPSSTSSSPQSEGFRDAIAQATILAQAGELPRSLALLTEQLAHCPDHPGLLYARALTLSDWGRLRESLESLRAAELRGLSSIGLHINIAQICHQLGFGHEAEQRVRQAIRLDSASARAHFCLATIMQGASLHEEAIKSYERAFELDPGRIECLVNIAGCKLDLKDGTAAEQQIRRVIALDGGDQAKSWTILGTALSLQGRSSEAEDAFERAEGIEWHTGRHEETFVFHGFDLFMSGRIDEALDLYVRHLPAHPHPRAHAHYAFALLAAGRFREGWEQYEFRRLDTVFLAAKPLLGRPAWNGQCLRGKTLLVWAEQGIGDTVQFARFARVLKSYGATVVLQVPDKLKDFAADFADFDRVILSPSELESPFDYQISTMSIARVLCPDIASIPADIPYVKTDPVRIQYWREGLSAASKLKVGLVWAGNPKHDNDRNRSMTLSELAPLWNIEGVQCFSLQKDRGDTDAANFPINGRLIDLAPQLHDFRDTAAAIEALDLVIAVDTSVAHVAGALGKPIWLLLPAVADWRWLTNRDDSPWYPTMRLFRQRQLGSWHEVVSRVEHALRGAVENRHTGNLADGVLPEKTVNALGEPAAARDSDPQSVLSGLSRVIETRYGIMQYMPDQVEISRSLELYGEWLQRHIDLLAKVVQPGSTVLEAPSGIGAHTLALANIVGSSGHVIAYESAPVCKRILLQNIRANKFGSVVTVMQRQLAGCEKVTLRELQSVSAESTGEMNFLAETETIDELLVQHLDLIKLNECALAHAILEGASETLWRLRPKLFLTLSDTDSLSRVANQVMSFGYRCWRIDCKLFKQDNFNRCDIDIFRGRTAIAMVAIAEESDANMLTEECVELQS